MYTFLKAKSTLKLVFSRVYKEKVFGLYGGEDEKCTPFLKSKVLLNQCFQGLREKKYLVYRGKMKFLKRKVINSSCREMVRQDKNKPA